MSKIPAGLLDKGIFGGVEVFLRRSRVHAGRRSSMSKAKMHGVQIGPARPGDGEAIARVHAASFLEAYRQLPGVDGERLARFVEDDFLPRKIPEWTRKAEVGGESLYVARIGHEVVGICEIHRGKNVSRYGGLYVSPEHQAKGIGTELFITALNSLRRPGVVYLDVTQNTPAIKLYKKLGFRIYKELPTPPPLAAFGVGDMPQWDMICLLR